VSATIHACCVAIGGRGVLIAGPSGSGKSDLSARLLDRGAVLVSDDYTVVGARDGWLLASPPLNIAGKIEIRGVGIVERPFVADIPVALLVDAGSLPERMPEVGNRLIDGVAVPSIALAALEASAPIKVEAALLLHGLAPS
jgi:serine kinase of HPr protein (carbohydrate metabolism regulator)